MSSFQKVTDADTSFITATRGVKVLVKPLYNPTLTNQQVGIYVYNYTITIENEGGSTVQLISRHWIIKDGFGKTEHVVGEGVVGKQPTLKPGESFTYTSSCPLQTPTGSMRGTFQMKGEDGRMFDAVIGEFQLAHTSLVN